MQLKSLILLLAVFLAVGCGKAKHRAPNYATSTVASVLKAAEEGDYTAFVEAVGDDIAKNIPEAGFDNFRTGLQPRFDSGATLEYIGFYETKDGATFLWKLRNREHGDVLVSARTAGGEVVKLDFD